MDVGAQGREKFSKSTLKEKLNRQDRKEKPVFGVYSCMFGSDSI